MTFTELRDMFLENHQEFIRLPLPLIEQYLRDAILSVQLLNLPALVAYYTKNATLSSGTAGHTISFRNALVTEYSYNLPADVLYGVENPILAIRYSSPILSGGIKTVGEFQKLSPSQYSKALNNVMQLSAMSPIYTIVGTKIRVFPINSEYSQLEIFYIRKADATADTVDMPDSYIPNILTEAERIVREALKNYNPLPDKDTQTNIQRLKITLDTTGLIKNKEIGDDLTRT